MTTVTLAKAASVSIPLILCGIFYGVLCIFSIVTGLIYMSGKKELNPLELPDQFVDRLENENRKKKFTTKMGLVTFIVGIVQGITSYSIIWGRNPLCYWIALGFTLFSIASVGFKLKGKINGFPLMKLAFYLAILTVLILKSTRVMFF